MRLCRAAAMMVMAGALVAAPQVASAQTFCVAPGYGGPGVPGEPEDWSFASSTGSNSYDDARWTGASGHSLTSGSASAPVELRALWGPTDPAVTGKFLYLSWQFFVDPSVEDANHVLYLGAQSGTDTKVIRLKFSGESSTGPVAYCNNPTSCPGNGYTVFSVPQAEAVECGTITDLDTAVSYQRLLTGSPGADLPWLTTSARYWKLDWIGTRDRWVVQLKIPIVAATGDMTAGIAEGTKLSYQAGLESVAMPGTFRFEPWPRTASALVSEQFCAIGGLGALVTVRDPAAFQPIDLTGLGADVAADQCGARVKVTELGVIDPLNPTAPLGWQLNTTGDTGLATRIENNSGAEIAAGTMFARFRIANWGVQHPNGSWEDVQTGAASGAEASNGVAIAAPVGSKGVIQLPWSLTPGQICQYTWEQRGAPAWDAGCVVCDHPGDPAAGDGAASRTDGICLPARTLHQCFAVELRGANVDFENRGIFTNLNFAPLSTHEQVAMVDVRGLPTIPGQTMQEIYFIAMPRNMPEAVQAKTLAELIAEAAVEILKALAQALAESQQPQPPPPPPNDGQPVMLQPRFDELRGPLRDDLFSRPPRPMNQDLSKFPEYARPRMRELGKLAQLKRGGITLAKPGGPDGPDGSGGSANEALVRAVAGSFDTNTLAHLVPTLEIYAYYVVPGSGVNGTPKVMAPLTSFALITHHDGPVNGLIWTMDGVTKVTGNIFTTRVPVEGFRRVRVRIQAREGTEPLIGQDKNWPCGCTCGGKAQECKTAYQMSNAGLLALAMFLATRRRRPRKRRGL